MVIVYSLLVVSILLSVNGFRISFKANKLEKVAEDKDPDESLKLLKEAFNVRNKCYKYFYLSVFFTVSASIVSISNSSI